ncbi:SRPBCC family protein [Dictyobacter arantiisoli]|uniref:Polyketide cyclase n=1 Tax=Dictyobacter arantiisoli TaxID=2014874 RepID=A0A5A5TB89_9CHLR|nr:SRPBCC family protein [Dictyobacter arantiisoli]GCF08760.1 hypothetical protein KDI_23240 [Dictyobacter arantiisoli]
MTDYESSLKIQALPDQVEQFISQVDNLPKYLPTTKSAMPQQGEHVRVEGSAHGHSYDSDGYFRVDKSRHRMEWGSNGEEKYSGWLQVTPLDAGKASEVVVHLTFDPSSNLRKEFNEPTDSKDKTIQEDLDKALLSIKNICEGKGGKVESKSAK